MRWWRANWEIGFHPSPFTLHRKDPVIPTFLKWQMGNFPTHCLSGMLLRLCPRRTRIHWRYWRFGAECAWMWKWRLIDLSWIHNQNYLNGFYGDMLVNILVLSHNLISNRIKLSTDLTWKELSVDEHAVGCLVLTPIEQHLHNWQNWLMCITTIIMYHNGEIWVLSRTPYFDHYSRPDD